MKSEVIKNVASILNRLSIKWAIIGSTSLALQGINTKPKDLDILIKNKDIQKVKRAFKDYKTTEIKKNSSEECEEFNVHIKDVEVQICADYETSIYSRKLDETKRIKCAEVEVNVFDLKTEAECYEKTGRKEKANMIRTFIKK